MSKDECPPCAARPNLLNSPPANSQTHTDRSIPKNENPQPRPETRGGGGGGRNPATRALTALTLIAALAALILYVYAAIPANAQSTTDYDTDGDNLIEINTLDQLNAVRWDRDGDGVPAPANTTTYAAAFPGGNIADTSTPYMGCAAACEGYELTADLDFDTDNSGSVGAGDDYPNWTPIGNVVSGYTAEFNGNGHKITDLTISSTGNAGLFGVLSTGGVIRDLGIITPSMSGVNYVGGLASNITGGSEIAASYVLGGTVALSATTGDGVVGGLVGVSRGTIRASYATASVNAGNHATPSSGGLAGRVDGTVIASYAAGAVSRGTGSNSNIGGFAGSVESAVTAITDSYCDTTVHSTTTPCIGSRSPLANTDATTVPGKTAAELQSPTGYTGIYANWRVDVDGDTFPDQPWNFGTTSQYPALKTPTERQADPATDYDADGDNLIEITSQAQLDAVRHDLDGDGLPANVSDYTAYAAVFPAGDLASTGTRMGCASGCAGYELTADLTLTGAWTPIDSILTGYAAEFNGNGYQISGLAVTGVVRAGLFGRLENGGTIRDLGLITPSASGSFFAGGLVGRINSGAEITASYVQGGTVAATAAGGSAGGLAGWNQGVIRAAYATAAVNAGSPTLSNAGGLTGNNGEGGHIIASYAAARVSGAANTGGLAGQTYSASSRITDSYCDNTVQTSTHCVGFQGGGATATSTGYSSEDLKTPTGYTGIYANWNIDLDGAAPATDYPWNFRTATEYPALNTPAQRAAAAAPPPLTPPPPPDPGPGNGGNGGDGGDGGNGGNGGSGTTTDTLPPSLPRSIPPEPARDYDPAADHPEIYNNAEYEMAATCQTHDVDPETGNPRAATVTFDLGSYTGPILLHLSIWANGRYMAYETQGLAQPNLDRNGQKATVRVDTDPAQTRFRLDGRRHGLAANLLLGYADCRSDDP